jgi:hypothetical protein
LRQLEIGGCRHLDEARGGAAEAASELAFAAELLRLRVARKRVAIAR